MSFIDWNAAALPSEIAGRQIQNQQAAFDLARQQQAYNALQGVNTGDVGSVNRGVNALTGAMMFDQAKALNSLGTQTAATTGAIPLIDRSLQEAGSEQEARQQRQEQMTSAFHAEMQKMADASDDLASTTDDAERAQKAMNYAQQWRNQGAPESEIQQVIGNLAPEALQSHAAAFRQASQGNYDAMAQNFQGTDYSGLGPGVQQGADILKDYLSPGMIMGLGAAGLPIDQILNAGFTATAQQRAAPYQPVQVPTPSGAPQVISGSQFAGATAGHGGAFTGPGTEQQAQMAATGAVAGGVGEAVAPDGSQVQGNWTKNPDGSWTLHGAAIQPAGGAPVAAASPSISSRTSQAGGSASNVQQANQFEVYSNGYLPRVTNLRNLRQAASTIPTGPQAPFWTLLGQLKQEYPALANLPIGPNATGTANFEEVRKVAQMVMAQQQDIMGLPKTNQSVDITSGATPHEENSPLGIQRLTGILAGNEDYINAERQAWNAWKGAGHDQSTFQDFVGGPRGWNKTFDPRVFQAQYMDPQQKAVVRAAVGPKRFDLEEGAARRLGLLGGQ